MRFVSAVDRRLSSQTFEASFGERITCAETGMRKQNCRITLTHQPADLCPSDEFHLYGIATAGHDNGDGSGCIVGCHSRWRTHRNNNVDLEDQLSREARESIKFPSAEVLKGDVLSFNVAEFVNALAENLSVLSCGRGATGREKPYVKKLSSAAASRP
jgi:hypothetical protein